MTLREFMAQASAAAELEFTETGEVRPMFHVMINGEKMLISPPPLPQDMSIFVIREVFTSIDPERVVFVDEAWIVAATPEMMKDPDTPEPKDHPDRRECILFHGEDRHEGIVLGNRDIIRKPGEKATLGPLRFADAHGHGRLPGLLENNRPKIKH